MIPANTLQDRNLDGFVDYLNARIYVADQATPDEIAAASNIAARLTFEAQSVDLPIGYPMSAYNASETSVAIVVGTAAKRFTDKANDKVLNTFDGSRPILAIPHASDAEEFARTLGFDLDAGIEHNQHASLEQTGIHKQFSLATLFTAEGLFGDADGDLIPEQVETTIILGPEVRAVEIIDLACRVALEATGIRLPLAVIQSDDAIEVALPPNAILIGNTNRYIQELRKSNRFQQAIPPAHGRIEIIRNVFGDRTVVVIAGADAAGEAEAVKHAATRLPFIWNYGKEHLHLSYIEDDLRRFFALRSPPGQAAATLCKAREAVKGLTEKDMGSARLELLFDGGQSFMDDIADEFASIHVTTGNLNVQSGTQIFEEEYRLTWEVEIARRRIREGVIPRIRPGSSVSIELRVSESHEIRAALIHEIQNLFLESGADPLRLSIRVLAAHKQGYCWIDEVLKPRLKGASRIRVLYRDLDPEELSTVESTNRWLHELYPIDEVLSRDLGIPADSISFHSSDPSGATYEVWAEDASGNLLLHEHFEPKFITRPMFDVFPDYAQVRNSTGWLYASVDGSVVADERIETDAEAFWRCYQSKTLAKIHNYILELYDGQPRAECAPHFGTLEVDLWLSEPDHRIGIDQERISTLEALHEDIYFETLLFFELLGLNNPGRIIPRVHRARDGQDGLARIRFTGKPGPNPRTTLTWNGSDGTLCRHNDDILPIPVEPPRILAMTVRSGHSSVVSLEIANIPMTRENLALFETVREFHRRGVGLDWLSYEGIDQITFGGIEIPRTGNCYRKPRITPLPVDAGLQIVQLETPIGPSECEQTIRKLASFPEVRPFHAGTSFLGHSIWALDVVSSSAGKYVSQAKLTVAKPVLFITGRQHANEVSSTTHILSLAELLATDPEIRKLLDRVNFILQPITNPDGAALVDELHRDTPEFMLHAGYLGALGTDVTYDQWSENPIYPEARVRPDLWRMWLPDVVLNPHGYPSHEWVQLFAGYTAWVKSRSVTSRDWWIPRGWFIPRFEFMEDSRDAALAIHQHAMAAMHETLGAWHDRMKRRYSKYVLSDSELNSQQNGLQPNKRGFTFMQRYPQVTLLETVSEAPDEVASGDWLKTLVQAGLEFSLAHARYLAENSSAAKRTIQRTADTTVLRTFRKRP